MMMKTMISNLRNEVLEEACFTVEHFEVSSVAPARAPSLSSPSAVADEDEGGTMMAAAPPSNNCRLSILQSTAECVRTIDALQEVMTTKDGVSYQVEEIVKCYEGVICGKKECLRRLEELSSADDMLATSYLTLIFYENPLPSIVIKDEAKARRLADRSLPWSQSMCKSEHNCRPYADYVFSHFLQPGVGGVVKDPQRAKTLLERSAGSMYAPAEQRLGSFCFHGTHEFIEDKVKGLDLLQSAANKGYARAQYMLSHILDKDRPISEEKAKKAFELAMPSAEQGYHLGQNRLGCCYYNGTGFEKDIFEALHWFRRCADQGQNYAQYNVGLCYGKIEGHQMQAVKWIQKSSDNGDIEAHVKLGDYYAEGKGVGTNAEEALQLYQVAADKGNKDAQKKLADLKLKLESKAATT